MDVLTQKYISEITEQIANQIINKVTKQTIFEIKKKPNAALKHLEKVLGVKANLIYSMCQSRAEKFVIDTYSGLNYKVLPLQTGGYEVIGTNSEKMYYCGAFSKEREAWVHVAKLKQGKV